MDITAVLSKLLNGDEISESERKFAEDFDMQKQIDGAQAAARKKLERRLSEVESERDGLQTKVSELEEAAEVAQTGKGTEVEQLTREMEKLKKAIEAKDEAVRAAQSEKASFMRETKIGRIIGKLKLVDGIDPDLPRIALERMLKDIETDDLDDESAVSPGLEKFVSTNKALVIDPAAGGGGTPPKDKSGRTTGDPQDPAKMSDEERTEALRKSGII